MSASSAEITFQDSIGESRATFSREYIGTAADGSRTSCVVDHVAWWVDSRGLAARLGLVGEYGLAGIAIWQLGGVDAASWSLLQGHVPGWTPPGGAPVATAPPVVVDSVERTEPTVSAKPSTRRPKRGKQVTVRVRVTPRKSRIVVKRQMRVGGIWRTKDVKRTNDRGRATFRFRWPREDLSRTYRVVTKARGTVGAGTSESFELRTR
jgi:hypothetical protein